MEVNGILKVRPATLQDCWLLDRLITQGYFVHRHLDWRTPLEWIGHPPYFVLEKDGSIKAVLACPPDPTSIGWVRVFGTDGSIPVNKAWEILWSQVKDLLSPELITKVAILSTDERFHKILKASEFIYHQSITMLTWEQQELITFNQGISLKIRRMTKEDILSVEKVDGQAFEPIWHNSLSSLEKAFQQAAYATVIMEKGNIIAYQISTHTMFGGHLARLAVHPDYQGNGIGKGLVRDLINNLIPMGVQRITVNTQSDNLASLALYKGLGFQETGERFPVFIFENS